MCVCARAHMHRPSKPKCGMWTTTVCVSFFTCVCVKCVYVSLCVDVGVSVGVGVHIFVDLIESETYRKNCFTAIWNQKKLVLAEVVYQGHYLAHIQLIHMCVKMTYYFHSNI